MTDMARSVWTPAQVREIDRMAVGYCGIPGYELMTRAGEAAFGIACQRWPEARRWLVLCGAGNNGGDGLAAVRHLGLQACRIALLAEPSASKSPDAALQLRILRAAGCEVTVGELPAATPADAVWIDALFGTGLDRPLAGRAREWVEAFNVAAGKKLAIDIPSGLHGDTGEVLGAACEVDVTVTFVARKRGLTCADGPRCAGRIVVAGLGLPH